MTRVRMPADVDRPDRLLAGLTAAQLGYAAAGILGLAAAHSTLRRVVAPDVALVCLAPFAVGVCLLVFGRIDGLDASRLAVVALAHARRRIPLIPAGEIPPLPRWAGRADAAAPLPFPVTAVERDGILDLGAEGAALICRASSLNFALRTDDEKTAIVAATERWLNALSASVQILVRAERADLSALVDDLAERAGSLPHPALENAARDHARWLGELAARADVLRRTVLVVFREPATSPGDVLHRRADDAATALAAAGITLTPLDGAAAVAALGRAADPDSPPRVGTALPGETIVGSSA